MALSWAANSSFKPPEDPELLRSIEERQKDFLTIDKDSEKECCKICGDETSLSLEHTPSKAAFNKSSGTSFSVLDPFVSKVLKWRAQRFQGGSKSKSLCETCNNHSGSWFNPAYVKFARHCAKYAKPDNIRKTINIEGTMHPARVIKQGLINICSVSQPGLCREYGHLKELVMGKETSLKLEPLKVGLYINANKIARSSGVTIFCDTHRKIARLIAEFSFWPLG